MISQNAAYKSVEITMLSDGDVGMYEPALMIAVAANAATRNIVTSLTTSTPTHRHPKMFGRRRGDAAVSVGLVSGGEFGCRPSVALKMILP